MRYITAKQYAKIADIPRGRMAARFLVFSGVIIEEDGKILLCRNRESKYPGWGLPGGKILWSENITEGAIREVLEETGIKVQLTAVLGMFQRETGPEDEEFLRIIFTGKNTGKNSDAELDPAVEERAWYPIRDILNNKVPLHSNQLIKEIERYNKGITFPLDVLNTYIW